MDMRGHVQEAGSPKTVKIAEPAAPVRTKPSDSTSAPGRGRQLRQGSSVAESTGTNDQKKKPKKPRTMEELDRRVENDVSDS